MTGQLVSADICQQIDKYKIDDGFRSYPSAHSSVAAGGLVYASLFMASKFVITIPFALPSAASAAGAVCQVASPSRNHNDPLVDPHALSRTHGHDTSLHSAPEKELVRGNNDSVQSQRRQAAAPPIYLLFLGLLPFGLSIFIAGSRWHDRRHHGFDILFGYLIGLVTSIFAFRYYHMPIPVATEWSWGPRSEELAFWSGVGKKSYADRDEELGVYEPHCDVGHSANWPYPLAGTLRNRCSPIQVRS
jgi:hypothetical protein